MSLRQPLLEKESCQQEQQQQWQQQQQQEEPVQPEQQQGNSLEALLGDNGFRTVQRRLNSLMGMDEEGGSCASSPSHHMVVPSTRSPRACGDSAVSCICTENTRGNASGDHCQSLDRSPSHDGVVEPRPVPSPARNVPADPASCGASGSASCHAGGHSEGAPAVSALAASVAAVSGNQVRPRSIGDRGSIDSFVGEGHMPPRHSQRVHRSSDAHGQPQLERASSSYSHCDVSPHRHHVFHLSHAHIFAHGLKGLTHDLTHQWDTISHKPSSIYDHEHGSHSALIDHHGSMSVVSVTEGKLAHVFQYLTLYFVSMYFLEMIGQACTLVISIIFEVGEFGGPCFSNMVFMLDVVFVMLLVIEVNLVLMINGLRGLTKKLGQAMLLVLLMFSLASLLLQVFFEVSGLPALIMHCVSNGLRAVRVVVFYKKLRVVLDSPLSQWDVHDDILTEDDHH